MMSRVTESTAPLIQHLIAPQTTDPEITWVPAVNPELANHYIWLDPSARGNPKLLVFMPGAGNVPASWQLFEQEAARLGYHVIGLVYQNDVEVVGKCGGRFNPDGHSLDPHCSGNPRLQVLTGADVSANVSVTPANSIDNRLAKLLGYLADQDRKSTRLNSSHLVISYAVFCLKKKKTKINTTTYNSYTNH